MKKILLSLFLSLSIFFLTACLDEEGNGDKGDSLYEITFKLEDGSTLFSYKSDSNEDLLFPANPIKEGYVFVGWFANDEKIEGGKVTGNLELVAHFDEVLITYQVRFFDGSVILATYEVPQNGSVADKIPSTDKTNYIFDGWFLNSTFTTAFNPSNTITQDLDIYGKWSFDTSGIPVGEYTGYYSSLNGLSNSALQTALRNMIKNTGSQSGSTGQVKSVDSWQGQYYLIYTGLGSYGNREHTVPASKLRDAKAPEDDLHNLRAAVISVNSTRGNYPFGSGSGGWKLTNGFFYPGDEHIGDVARIVFYITTRYNVPMTAVGNLQMFLEWHAADPVNQFELTRNERIFGIQKNRNPFIDHPELAYVLFGSTPTSTAYETPMYQTLGFQTTSFSNIFTA